MCMGMLFYFLNIKNLIHMKNYYFFLFLLIPFLFSTHLHAQLQVQSNGYTPNQLVRDVLMGTGVEASNVSFTGTDVQRGYFDGSNSNIGIGSGVVLSTGNIAVGIGPNDTGDASFPYDSGCGVPESNIPASEQGPGGLCRPGDDDLNALLPPNANTQTFDAAVLEFDFVPQHDNVIFNYVFASEEYPEYVCSIFNDVFGFFISGPKPDGGMYDKENIATIPYTPLPVAINTVNPGIPGSEANAGTCAGGTGSLFFSNYYVSNDSNSVQFDGFTTNLQAVASFIPGKTYHIKLAVADAGDGIFDSAVFLEAHSFKSLGTSVNVTTPEDLTNFEIQPNPSDGRFNVDVEFSTPQIATIQILNTLGQEVYHSKNMKKHFSENVDISKEGLGTYFVIIRTEKGRAIQKIVLTK